MILVYQTRSQEASGIEGGPGWPEKRVSSPWNTGPKNLSVT